MPRDLEGLADIVVLTVKNAMAPLLERLALVERENVDLRAALQSVTDLRERVVTVETKSALPVAPPPAPPAPVDVTPLYERLSVAEAAIDRLGTTEQNVADLRERFAALEVKSAAPTMAAPPDSLTASDVDMRIGERLAPLQASIAEARERLVAVEVRQPIPGPPGKDGLNGTNGKDGADGFAFDDLMVVQQDDRSFSIKALKGDRAKDIGTARFPVQIGRGVFIDGKSYEPGDIVTWAGSSWHCITPTAAKPGEGSKDWQLVVKRGRDGKDGRDAIEPVPVVRVGR